MLILIFVQKKLWGWSEDEDNWFKQDWEEVLFVAKNIDKQHMGNATTNIIIFKLKLV